MIRGAIICVITLFIVGCGGRNQSSSSELQNRSTPKKIVAFTPPQIPSTITDNKARLEYFTTHYWDNFDFADSLLVYNDSITGTAIAGYISLLQINNPSIIKESIKRSLQRGIDSDYDNFLQFSYRLDDYLDDPNSPMRNEELYIQVLQFVTNSPKIDTIDKIAPQRRLEMVLKNRVGEVATNFEYTLKDGSKHNMHDIEAEYTILFFNSPNCSDCGRVKSYIVESEGITKLHKSGKLKILAIYPEANLDIWRAAEYDPIMINSCDKGEIITKNRLYDLRAIPTLYLLDSQKNVELKDVSIEQIEIFIEKM